jgi:hypothetical protein
MDTIKTGGKVYFTEKTGRNLKIVMLRKTLRAPWNRILGEATSCLPHCQLVKVGLDDLSIS